MMDLSKKLKQRRDINKQIRKLYAQKSELDNEIIEYLELNFEDVRNTKIDVDDENEIFITYKDKIDAMLVREKYPDIYNAGQRLYFDWQHAILMFENKKDFWALINDCKIKEKRLKIAKSRK